MLLWFDTQWHKSSFVLGCRWEVKSSVVLPFDPQNECFFSPRVVELGAAVSAPDHTGHRVLDSGLGDCKTSVRISLVLPTLHDLPPHVTLSPPHIFSWQDCFRPIVCCQLTGRCINYEHLVQTIVVEICERARVSLNDGLLQNKCLMGEVC